LFGGDSCFLPCEEVYLLHPGYEAFGALITDALNVIFSQKGQ